MVKYIYFQFFRIKTIISLNANKKKFNNLVTANNKLSDMSLRQETQMKG